MKKWAVLIVSSLIIIGAITLIQTTEKKALDPKETIELLSVIEDKSSDEAYLLAQAYLTLNDQVNALTLLETQVLKTPEDNRLWVLLFDLKKATTTKDHYFDYLKTLLKTNPNPEAIKRLETFMPKPPYVSHPSGEYSESITIEILKQDPHDTIYIQREDKFVPLPSDTITLISDETLVLYSKNSYGTSETITLSYNFDNLNTLIKLAEESTDDEAIMYYEKILEKYPQNEPVLDALIGLYEKIGNYDRLIEKLHYGNKNFEDYKYSIALRQLIPETPRVNVKSGRYGVSQLIRLTNRNINYRYHYTLDGSEPTVDSPLLSQMINVTEGFSQLKIMALSEKNIKSETATYTYTIFQDESLILFTYDRDQDGRYDLFLKTWEDRLTDSKKLMSLDALPKQGKLSSERTYIGLLTEDGLKIIDALSGEQVYEHHQFSHYDSFTFGAAENTIYLSADGQVVILDWTKDHWDLLETSSYVKDIFYRNSVLLYSDQAKENIYYHRLDNNYIENTTENEEEINKYRPSFNKDNHSLIYHTNHYTNDSFNNDLIYVDKEFFTETSKITEKQGNYTLVSWVQNQTFLCNYKEASDKNTVILFMDIWGDYEELLSVKGQDIYALDYK